MRARLLTAGVLALTAAGCAENPAPLEARRPTLNTATATPPPVMMQGFYWDSPNESGSGEWWDFVAARVPELAKAGFTHLWLPPAQKSHNNPSMGYDPYDFYDLGEFNQKMGVETWFGSRAEHAGLITTVHAHGMKAIADVVYNHKSGGGLEYNPNTGTSTYTSFTPLSGAYQLHYNNFHPSTYEQSDQGTFGDMPDLAHVNPDTWNVVLSYQKWLKNTVGYDGWRYDYVKGFHPWVVRDLQRNVGGWGVGEFWDGNKALVNQWLASIEYTASAFDFPLFYAIKSMCSDNSGTGGYDMRSLWGSGVLWDHPFNAVTFVENHDTDVHSPVVNDKMMCYAVVLTHEGKPTVFWRDWYNYNLARSGTPHGIERLVWVYQNLAHGTSSLLYADPDVYVMQRNGTPGLVVMIIDNVRSWKRQTVKTKWPNTTLKAYAWNSEKDRTQPATVKTDGSGNVTLSAAPRGYAVFAP